MSISNYCSTNHQWGSIGSGWASLEGGAMGGMKRGREGLKMLAERQKNNWSIRKDGFCHFEKGCQWVVHSHLLRAISSNSGGGWHISPSHCRGPILPRLGLVHHHHAVSINHNLRDNDTRSEQVLFSLAVNLHRSAVHLQRAISNNDLSPHCCNCKAISLYHFILRLLHIPSHNVPWAWPFALLHAWGEEYTLPVPVWWEWSVYARWLTQ